MKELIAKSYLGLKEVYGPEEARAILKGLLGSKGKVKLNQNARAGWRIASGAKLNSKPYKNASEMSKHPIAKKANEILGKRVHSEGYRKPSSEKQYGKQLGNAVRLAQYS